MAKKTEMIDREWHSGQAAYDINFDRFAGYSINGKPILPLTDSEGGDSVLDHIWTGQTIAVPDSGIITYGFFTGNHAVGINNNPHLGEGKGYTPFSAAQKAAAVASIQLWDDLIPQTFVNVGDVSVKNWAQKDATILFANTSTGPAQAWAYYPGGSHQYARTSSDVWIADPNYNGSNLEFDFGQYGRTTLIHEIGHTLGLSHPGNYNGSAATTYDAQAEYFQDSQQYTIMSYWGGWNTGGAPIDWNYSGGFLYDNSPQGPMLHDIVAIQAAYGADPTTRAGATVYGFNSNAGNDMFDFSKNSLPYYALYDAGGEDTIDLSGFTSSQYLNLNAGEFSSIGDVTLSQAELGQALHDTYLAYYGVDLYAAGHTNLTLGNLSLGWLAGTKADNASYIEFDTGVAGIGTVNYETFAIAYNTTIENAVGGQGRDLIVGNEVGNHIDGQAGNDVLQGGGGDDVLVGGLGNDLLQGGADNDTLIGGDGNDILQGGSGDDILIGGIGNDTLTGGSGHDTFVFDNLELGDVITDFGADDVIDLSQLGDNLSYIGNSAFTGLAGEVQYVDGALALDANGDMAADFSVLLSGMPPVTSDQIVLVA